MAIDFSSNTATFIDSPDDETLSSPAITSNKHAFVCCAIFFVFAFEPAHAPAPFAKFDSELFGDGVFGAEEAEGEKDEVGGVFLFGARDRNERGAAFGHDLPVDFDGFDGFDISVSIVDEFDGLDCEASRIFAEFCFGFFVPIIDAEDSRPLWPRVVGSSLQGRFFDDFEIDERFAAVSHGGAEAVIAGVAAADNDDVLSAGTDVLAVC